MEPTQVAQGLPQKTGARFVLQNLRYPKAGSH